MLALAAWGTQMAPPQAASAHGCGLAGSGLGQRGEPLGTQCLHWLVAHSERRGRLTGQGERDEATGQGASGGPEGTQNDRWRYPRLAWVEVRLVRPSRLTGQKPRRASR